MPALLATLRDHDDLRLAMWDGFSGPAPELAVDQGAGAALFSSVSVSDRRKR